jgi:hypothetical protein
MPYFLQDPMVLTEDLTTVGMPAVPSRREGLADVIDEIETVPGRMKL